MKIQRYTARLEWGLGVTWGRHLLRIGIGPWLWRVEWNAMRTPAFMRRTEQLDAQWLIPIPFVQARRWVLITWTWPPSATRI